MPISTPKEMRKVAAAKRPLMSQEMERLNYDARNKKKTGMYTGRERWNKTLDQSARAMF